VPLIEGEHWTENVIEQELRLSRNSALVEIEAQVALQWIMEDRPDFIFFWKEHDHRRHGATSGGAAAGRRLEQVLQSVRMRQMKPCSCCSCRGPGGHAC
jgi:hypothetical protein